MKPIGLHTKDEQLEGILAVVGVVGVVGRLDHGQSPNYYGPKPRQMG